MDEEELLWLLWQVECHQLLVGTDGTDHLVDRFSLDLCADYVDLMSGIRNYRDSFFL